MDWLNRSIDRRHGCEIRYRLLCAESTAQLLGLCGIFYTAGCDCPTTRKLANAVCDLLRKVGLVAPREPIAFRGTWQGQGARSQELGVRGRESGVRSRESGVRSRESGVRSRESGVGSRESGVGSQESGVGSQGSGVEELGASSHDSARPMILSQPPGDGQSIAASERKNWL